MVQFHVYSDQQSQFIAVQIFPCQLVLPIPVAVIPLRLRCDRPFPFKHGEDVALRDVPIAAFKG